MTEPKEQAQHSSEKKTTSKAPEAPKKASHSKGVNQGRANLALFISIVSLLALGGAIAFGYLHVMPKYHQMAASSTQAHSEQAILAQKHQSIEQQFSEIVAHQDQLEETLNRLTNRFDQLPQLSLADKNRWRLSEAEYLAKLAHYRLTFHQDTATAAELLAAVDRQLQAMNDLDVTHLRQLVSQQLATLNAQPLADKAGLTLNLDAIIEQVELLPVPSIRERVQGNPEQSTQAEADKEEGWKQQVKKSWEAIKALVVIRRLDDPIKPLMAPEQRVYLNQQLALLLHQAQVAVLLSKPELYVARIQKAMAWIRQYFTLEDPRTEAVIQSLETLKNADIVIPPVDLSSLISAISEYREQRLSPDAQREQAPLSLGPPQAIPVETLPSAPTGEETQ